ncbi:MAG: cell division protein FtsA [Candidatus Hatepunaea meridiana]|nr:cell division protein FtsA [Candidatus Hatepunaea meridiana]
MAFAGRFIGVDLGTTKISAIIAELDENGEIQVVGVGNTISRGLRRGVVVNIDKTTDAIRTAVEKAEQQAGIKVRDVYVGIAGDHIRSINSRGVIAVSRGPGMGRSNEITQNDVDRVIEAARAVALPMDREVLHVLPQNFTVDDESKIPEPIGMSGLRLEADVHIITGAIASAQNIYRCVRNAGLGLRGLVLEPLASSLAVLTDDEKELGVALLDLGGGTTDIAVFYEGSIRHSSVIGWGGMSVTRDIAAVLGIPVEKSELLKLERGDIFPPVSDKEPFEVQGTTDDRGHTVDPVILSEIIRARMEEIFGMVLRELKRVDCMDSLSAGIVVTGGGSQLKGTAELARLIFGKTVRIGVPRGLQGLVDTVHNPAFATGVGLILYGMGDTDETGFIGDDTVVFKKIFKLFKGWFDGLVN